jgi:hypothetical protein
MKHFKPEASDQGSFDPNGRGKKRRELYDIGPPALDLANDELSA